MASNNKEFYEPKRNTRNCRSFRELFGIQIRSNFLGEQLAVGITLAYILFYAFLAAFFAVMMIIFLRTLPAYHPRYTLGNGIIGTNPGLGYRPRVDVEKNLIYFDPNKPQTYKPHVDDLKEFLKVYETSDQSEGEGFLNCEEQQKMRDTDVCRVDIKQVSRFCDKSLEYGYTEGKPCVLIKLNKIYGWKPEPYTSKVPVEIADRYDNRYTTIRCFGENAADKENIGEISYYPPQGIKSYYFPYLNQRGYQTPFVMVKFNNLERGLLVNVVCKAYAGNIAHDKPNEEIKLKGSVHFELLID